MYYIRPLLESVLANITRWKLCSFMEILFRTLKYTYSLQSWKLFSSEEGSTNPQYHRLSILPVLHVVLDGSFGGDIHISLLYSHLSVQFKGKWN